MAADVMNIDTSGIHALEEVHKKLIARGLQVIPFSNSIILYIQIT